MYVMMGIITKSLMGMIAGMMVGSIILGYCLYFDHQRVKDPQYKRKIREKRVIRNEEVKYPNRNDCNACREFVNNEVKLSEEVLGRGDVAGGVAHVANAVIVSNYPQKLLQILQQTLPPYVFYMLIEELRSRKQSPINMEWLPNIPE